MKKIILSIVVLTASAAMFADVKVNSLFSDNMVLQRNAEVPVWGKADEGEKVTVEFAGQTVSAVTQNGQWLVKLKSLKASNVPQEMIVTGKNSMTVRNILVGEVWVASGQSNMERQLGLRPPQKPILNWKQEAKDAQNYPQIREFTVARNSSDKKIEDAKSKWVVCDSVSATQFSAVGFFFARALTQQLKVPVGILFSAVGGTPAEKWTSRTAMEVNPELKSIVDNYEKSIEDFPNSLSKYKLNEDSLLKKWKSDTIAARIANKPMPKKPSAPIHPIKAGDCGGLYNAMIAPLIPYAIKGVIWYQGEANAWNSKRYQTLFPAMMTDWRKQWSQGEFPFLFVQIAPYMGMRPEIREAQLVSWTKTPNTAMVVTVDCGDSADIHPSNKRPVGERLALAAQALAYSKRVIYSGPVYKSMLVKGATVELRFDFNGKGLVAKGDALTDFTITGADKKFVQAKAVIQGDKIVVSSDKVANPVAVRMGWSNVPHVNLFNKDGLPATPFRTDIDSEK
jgi:sialate O-acetylesterase